MGLREIKAKARGDLHLAMRVPVAYVAPGGAIHTGVHARVHSKFDALGDLQGTSLNYAERIETVPKLVFWRAEIDLPVLKQQGIVVVSATEGYRLNTAEPPDLATVTWLVTILKAADLVGLPTP